jgi:hypothetical protein
VQHLDRAGVLERRAAGQHLVHGDAEREQIGAQVDPAIERLLRRGVERGADDGPGRGEPRAVCVAVGEDRQSEVGDARDLALRSVDHQHVVRLEVAMDESAVVGVGQAETELAGQLEGALLAQRPLVDDDARQRSPLDVLHGQVEQPLRRLAEVEHRDHVRVREQAGSLRLLGEAEPHGDAGRQIAEQDLERDLPAVQAEVMCAVNPTHRALTHALLDLVQPVDRGSHDRIGVERRQLGAIGRTSIEAAAIDRPAGAAAPHAPLGPCRWHAHD